MENKEFVDAPAFPCKFKGPAKVFGVEVDATQSVSFYGLTRLDYFAAKAMQAELSDASPTFGENSPEARVFAYVKDLLNTLGPQLYSVSLASVADALGWQSDGELKRAIVRALDQLAYGEPSILERHFLLWPADDDSVLTEPIGEISDLELRRALESNVLTLAETGEQVADFKERITVEYVLRSELRASGNLRQVKSS